MHRLIVTSATYRQASRGNRDSRCGRVDPREPAAVADEQAAARGRGDPRRRPGGRRHAEPEAGGPGIKPRIPPELLVASQRNKWPVVEAEGPEHWRRSVYIYVKRQLPFPMLELFDAPNTAQTCDRRDESTVPTQALVLMNDEFTHEQAGTSPSASCAKLAAIRACKPQHALLAGPVPRAAAPSAWPKPVAFLYAAASGPSAAGQQPTDAAAKLALTDLCHVLFNCNEFAVRGLRSMSMQPVRLVATCLASLGAGFGTLALRGMLRRRTPLPAARSTAPRRGQSAWPPGRRTSPPRPSRSSSCSCTAARATSTCSTPSRRWPSGTASRSPSSSQEDVFRKGSKNVGLRQPVQVRQARRSRASTSPRRYPQLAKLRRRPVRDPLDARREQQPRPGAVPDANRRSRSAGRPSMGSWVDLRLGHREREPARRSS